MRYQISGKQIDVGEALTTHVKTELGETIDKYSQRPTDAIVIFSRNAHEFICDAVVHLSTGLNVQAKGASTEIYAAFEAMQGAHGQAAAPLQAPVEGPPQGPRRAGCLRTGGHVCAGRRRG
jgi:ribosomal subunit interface protein